MVKKVFLGSGHELGSVVSTRSSNFEPVENYIEIISEFEDSYDLKALDCANQLFIVHGSENIVATINDCIMANYFEDESDLEGVADYLRQNGNSEWMVEFMKNYSEELYATDIIRALAKPGQKIKIQTTDLEHGNTEFEINT